MTVSGTKTFELDVTEYIEEAFERCGLEARTGYDIKTAKRSLNLASGGLGQSRPEPAGPLHKQR
jgi:hypothetical protein